MSKWTISLILIIIIFPIIPAYSQTVSWEKPTYGIGEVGLITLESKEMNKNPVIIDLVKVWTYSETDPTGIQILVLETGGNTNIFEGEIEFGNVTNASMLKVSEGDEVFARYDSMEARTAIQGTAPLFTLKTESSFQKGDSIKIEGSIINKKYDPNLQVVVEILDPDGKSIFTSQKHPTPQGNYSIFTNTQGASWIKTGEYTILAQYGLLKAETNFSYSNPNYDIGPYEEHMVPWGLMSKSISPSQVELSWNPPTNTYGLNIIGYNINEKIGTDMYEEISTIADQTNFTLSGLEMGKTHTFVVQARYSTGVSEISEEVSVDTPKGISDLSDSESLTSNNTVLPKWIRNNAGWWAKGSINDTDFISGMQFLIKEEIITIPQTAKSTSESSHEIPAWVKNNAEWWSNDLISDYEFVRGIQYLVEKGIVIVPEPVNQPPTISINSPDSRSSFEQGTLLSFLATATDPEDGILTSSSSIFWSSTIDGTFGHGSSFSKSALSVGNHTITVRATDSEGLFDRDSIILIITPRR